jgi:hypothetical protein
MSLSNIAFHRAREIQELASAGSSKDPAVKTAHQRPAAMHAAKAAKAQLTAESGVGMKFAVRDPATFPHQLAKHLIIA